MSKKFKATLPCPNCGNYFEATLYRSIWGEYPENRKMVFDNTINSPICPHCNVRGKIGNASLMYTNAKMLFAVWYEPEYDSGIDKEKQEIAKMLGDQNYLTQAPRIKNWDEFKRTIEKYESGVLKSNFSKFSQNVNKSKNSGCLLFFVIAITISTLLIFI